MSGPQREAAKARNAVVRVIAAWCAARACSSKVAVLFAVDDGYYLSCRRSALETHRMEEFDCFYRERGEFHEQKEADKWAIVCFRGVMQQAFDVDMTECPVELLGELGVAARGLRR